MLKLRSDPPAQGLDASTFAPVLVVVLALISFFFQLDTGQARPDPSQSPPLLPAVGVVR